MGAPQTHNFFPLLDRFTFNEDLDDFSLCFRIKLLRLRGKSNFVVSYAHTITDNALIASESHLEMDMLLLWVPFDILPFSCTL